MYEEHGSRVTLLLSCLSIVALSLNNLSMQNFFNVFIYMPASIANHYLFGALLPKAFCAVWFLMLLDQRF